MKVKIIAIGKVKQDFIKLGLTEFARRFKKHFPLEILELPSKATHTATSTKKIIELEGAEIIKKIPTKALCIACDVQGKQFSSEDFADLIEQQLGSSTSEICFIIGGAYGLSRPVLERANLKLSFSKMTFTYQMSRLILTEQLYRAISIIYNLPYHKGD